MSTAPGSLEGKYEVIAKIREGGMGAIYKARHRLLNELRVIKVMRPEVAQSADQRKRFLREAQTATRLRHPNIVAFYDFFVDEEDTAYMVMEYIEGINLRDTIRGCGAFPVALAIDLSRQCLSAFEYLHKRGIVHRDVSPDNIMMTRDEDGTLRAKLIDLGIAKIAQAKEELTAADEFIGKLRYSSPEQLTKSASSPQIDGRSDLFSLGIVLYEILTGICPYGGESLHEIIANRLEQPPLSFDVSDPKKRLPPALKKAVLKSLERSPGHRHQTAAEFSRALEPFADAAGAGRREQVDRYVSNAMALAAETARGQEKGAADLGPTMKANVDPTAISGPVQSARDEKVRNTIARWSDAPPLPVAPAGRSARTGEVDGITFPERSDVAPERGPRRASLGPYAAVAVAAALLVGFGVWISRRNRGGEANPVDRPTPAAIAANGAAAPGAETVPASREKSAPPLTREPERAAAFVPKEPTPLAPGAAGGAPAASPRPLEVKPSPRPRPTSPPRLAQLIPTKSAGKSGIEEQPGSPAGESAAAIVPGPKMSYCPQFDDTVYRQGVTKDVPVGFESMAARAPRPDSGLMRVAVSLSKERPTDDEPFTVAVRFENGGDARVDVQRLEESSSRGGMRPVGGAAVPVSVSPGGVKEIYRYPLTLSGGEPYSKQFVVSDGKGDSWRTGIRIVPCGD
jgi:eukaryotic-like serine/threonine-protein kinase